MGDSPLGDSWAEQSKRHTRIYNDMIYDPALPEFDTYRKSQIRVPRRECTEAMEKIGQKLGICGPEAQLGGRKDDDGKLRYDLIPGYPLGQLAAVYTLGAGKYTDHNWRKGMRWGRLFAAMCRHAWAWWCGERLDPQDGQHHLASVAWIAFTLMEYEKYKLGEDDRWNY